MFIQHPPDDATLFVENLEASSRVAQTGRVEQERETAVGHLFRNRRRNEVRRVVGLQAGRLKEDVGT